MLRLRQAKLSFPSVHLIVGVFSDEQIRVHGSLSFPATAAPLVPHLERCELVRHVRWVDEVLPSAPFVIDSAFLVRNKIDYVAVEEGSSVDPKLEKVRLGGYDLAKTLGES
jgi:glycerol-3-phosphate cytidylyltransferase-like family protein